MLKLVLEKAEEPEIKLPTFTVSSKKQEFQKNIYFCFTDYAKAFDCVDHNKLWEILKDGNTRPTDLPLEKPISKMDLSLGQQVYCKNHSLRDHTGLEQIAEPHKVILSSIVKCEYELLESGA